MLSKTLSSTEEHLLKHTAGILYVAGIDTSAASLMHFFRIILDHPDMQARAAAELDSVLPQGQLPTLDDEARLPYITALVLESMRYRPLAPQVTYSSPHDFKPDRFLNEDGTFNKEIFNPRDITFGYGRRICPGKDLAYTTLWLVAACVLRTCTVVKAKSANGTVIEPPSECVGVGVAMMPAPFQCAFVPRSEEAREMIMATEA
ncbi:cytochrome P450 [Schizophyllum commune Tattone D]|nr:cytochrome P450 [Schizophyllum commune Tattone D]